MSDTGDISVYTPNALNQYTDLNGGGLYYDGNFNLMWTGGFSAGYDADKRLTAIASGEDYGQFVYDGLGRCLKRTIDWETILITYDGWKPIVEWDEWNGLKAWNVYGPSPDEILYRHDAYLAVDLRYHLDRLGNVVFILDSDGNGIERYTYDAFGTPTVTDWSGNNARTYSWYGNRFMFTGREYFPELGLYDYRFRFYHPALGRFLQSDPTGFDAGDANLFRYCGGDPVNGIDPSGENGTITRFGDNGYNFGMNIFFNGGYGTTAQSFVNYANERLTNTFGAYNITANITIATGVLPSLGVVQNTFTLEAGRGGGYTSGALRGAFGANKGYSDPAGGQGLTGADLFLHEILHLLGAQDHYTGTGANRKAEPGWEDNIMGGAGGNQINATNIKEIIDSNGWGNVGHLDFVGYSLTQAFSNTVDALANYAAGHGPGIGVVTVSGPGGSQIFIIPFTGYTSGFSVSPGSLSGAALDNWTFAQLYTPGGGSQPGEGTHPVSWELR